jgi:hypothetical protein
MDLVYELDRIIFIINRDGPDEGKKFAKRITKIYLDTCKGFRKKFHSRYHPMRYAYIQSAWSARYILREML